MAEGKWRELPPVERSVEVPREPSQTFLRTHDRCDRSGYLYLLHEGGVGSSQMNRGTIAHRTIAKITHHAIDSAEEHGPVEAVEIPPEVGKDYLNETLAEAVDLQVPAGERDSLRAMIFNFCVGTRFEPQTIIGVEQSLRLRLGEWEIHGTPDLLEMPHPYRVDVTDYKTSFAIPTQEQFEGDFQTQLYALMLAFGEFEGGLLPVSSVEEFGLRQVFPRWPTDDGLAMRYTTVTRQQLLDFKLDLEAQLERLALNEETGKWPATPGSHCAECVSPAECPLPRHLRPESQMAVANEHEAQKLAEWAYLEGARVRRAKARVKAWADHNHRPSVPIGTDQEFAFVEREEYVKLDRAGFLAEVEGAVEYGTTIDLDHYRTKQPSVRFEVRRRSNGDETGG